MPWFVHAPDMPVIVEYPDEDRAPDIADFYRLMIEKRYVWNYYFGQDGDEGSAVVQYGELPSVSVTPEPPEGSTRPVRHSRLNDDARDTDIFHDVDFDDPDDDEEDGDHSATTSRNNGA